MRPNLSSQRLITVAVVILLAGMFFGQFSTTSIKPSGEEQEVGVDPVRDAESDIGISVPIAPPGTSQSDVSRIVIGDPYRSKRFYEFVLPHRWTWQRSISNYNKDEPHDNVTGDGSFFTDDPDQLSLRVQVNYATEVTPFFTDWPFCLTETNLTIWQRDAPVNVYSSIASEVEGSPLPSCAFLVGIAILNNHTVETRVCLGDSKQISTPTIVRGYEEFAYICPDGMDLIRLALFCDGTEWRGIAAQNKCVQVLQELVGSLSNAHNN